jgi:hypothetical protein
LDRLLARFGIYYHYEHNNGNYKLIFNDTAPPKYETIKCSLNDYKETESIGFQEVSADLYDFTSVSTTNTILKSVKSDITSSPSLPSKIKKNMKYQYVLNTNTLSLVSLLEGVVRVRMKGGVAHAVPTFKDVEKIAKNAVTKIACSEASMQHNIYGEAIEGKEFHSEKQNEFLYSFRLGEAYKLEDVYRDLSDKALFIKELKFKIVNNSFGEKGFIEHANSVHDFFSCKFKAQPNTILFAPPLHSIKTTPISVNFF